MGDIQNAINWIKKYSMVDCNECEFIHTEHCDENFCDNNKKAQGIAILALEKQIPKKPDFYGDSEDGKMLCSSCGEDLWDLKECGFNYCPYCGQALDWEEARN